MTAARTGARASGCPACPTTATTASTCSASTPSKNDENVVYALFENTKNGDFKPYLYKSTNRGGIVDVDRRRPAGQRPGARRSPKITSIPTCCSPAPSSACSSPSTAARSGCACAATCRRSRCATWRSRSARTISCSATFGRGFYVLDDYSPLRHAVAGRRSDRDGHIFPTQGRGDRSAGNRQVARLAGRAAVDGARTARSARSSPTGSRTPPQSARQRRRRWRRAARSEEGDAAYPTQAELTAEDGRRSAADVPDDHRRGGKVVRRLTVPGGRGIHRYVWNLRGIAPTTGGRRIRRRRWWRRR